MLITKNEMDATMPPPNAAPKTRPVAVMLDDDELAYVRAATFCTKDATAVAAYVRRTIAAEKAAAAQEGV